MPDFDRFLETLRVSLPLSRLLEQDGVSLKRQGSNLVCRCPIHDERTPSCTVYDDERFFCYGCGARGDLIDYWQRKHGGTFWEACTELARLAGISLPERSEEEARAAETERKRQESLEEYCERAHRALLAHPEALAYLQGRGLTLETIQARMIGLGTAEPLPDEMLRGRILFPVRRGGRIVNVVGRARGDDPRKYVNLSDTPIYPYDARLMRSDRVLLVEGVVDALLLQQAGIDAVATIGTFFKADWLPLCRQDAEYLLCYDQDANGAGQGAARRIATALWDAGMHRVSIVSLPDGLDPADTIQAHGAGKVRECVSEARYWVDYLIDTLPPPRNQVDLTRSLEETVFPALRPIGQMARDGYLEKIAARFGVRKTSVRHDWENWKKGREAGYNGKREGAPTTTLSPLWTEDNPLFFNPAQSFVRGLGVYCVHLRVQGEEGLLPFLVTSDRRLLPLDNALADSLQLVSRPNKKPSESVSWPIGTRYRNNVRDWIEGKESLNPAGLYESVRGLFRRYIHWRKEWAAVYDLVTLWVLGTYVHQMFDSYPYVHLRAFPDSGKTTVLRVVEGLAFRAQISAAITESVISRLVNSDSATLLIDEAENYRSKAQEEGGFIFEVLKGGYKRGAFSMKAGGKKDDFKPEIFDIYSAKMFASTQEIDPILATRCIDVPLERTDRQLAPFLPEEMSHELLEIRAHAHVWALSAFETIREAYAGLQPPENWLNRSWELWKPVIALAQVFSPILGRDLDAEMLKLADRLRVAKVLAQQEQDSNYRIMQAILDFVRINRPACPEEWYAVSRLTEYITQHLGWKERMSEKRLYSFVFDEARLGDRKDDKKRSWSVTGNGQHIRLREERCKEQARRLFKIEDQVEIEAPDPWKEEEKDNAE